MKKSSILVAVAVTVLFSAFSAQAANLAYMSVDGGDFGTLDLDTGAFTLVSNLGITIAGFGVAGSKLYAASYQTGSSILYTVDPTIGTLSAVGPSSVDVDDFGSSTTGLYAIGSDTNLYRLDPATGAGTLIGPTGLAFGSWRALSVSTNDSALYFADGVNLYTLDTATGAATLIGNMGGPQIGAILQKGSVFYAGQETPDFRVDTLDPVTGVATAGPPLTGTSLPFFAIAPDPLPDATPAPPVITSPLVATATANLPFSYQLEAMGAQTLAVDEGTLPPGLTFDSSLSAIVGSTMMEGTFQVALSASNTGGTTDATLVLTVQPFPAAGPVIMNVTSATGRTGSPFRFQIFTSGGSSAASVRATGLPTGLSLDSATGEITGTVTMDGSFSVTLSVTEAGIMTTATLQLTFTSDLAVPVIVSPNSANLFPGLPFSYAIEAPSSDPSDPVTYSEVGPLPQGLGLDQDAGIISGTPQLGFNSSLPGPHLAGGVVTNTQIFACNSSGCAAQSLFFLLPTGAANISTRLSVGTDDDVLIGGFITRGNAPMKLLVRADGPSLPLGGLLADPFVDLYSGPTVIASNDNWKDNLAGGSQEVAIENTGLAPANDLESAILAALQPGAYTAVMRGNNNGTGVGLVEVYNLGAASLDVSSNAQLGNISTRGKVQTGDNVMIGGFINQGATPIKVVVRALGPELAPLGVNGVLADPMLELHKADGTITINDSWTEDPAQKAEIMATGYAPSDPLESAIVFTLPVGEGAYTAIVRGANGTTGVGLVEVYFGDPCLGTSCP